MWIVKPYLYITKKRYKKVKILYRKRRQFKKIKPILGINTILEIPNNAKWYLYKGRIFIYRKWNKIASFVITKNNVYNPLEACGGELNFGYEFNEEIKQDKMIKLYCKDCWKNIDITQILSVLLENGINLS